MKPVLNEKEERKVSYIASEKPEMFPTKSAVVVHELDSFKYTAKSNSSVTY